MSGRCEEHASLRVRYPEGTLLGWREHLCVSDTWTITADGSGLLPTPGPAPTGPPP